jgi:HTH-type transcriptional regulator / antitoxin HigA
LSEIAMTGEIKPIRNDADHAQALAAIEGVWQAAPGTPEHDRLEVLAMLVDEYESRRWPIAPSDPVDLIRYVMGQHGLTRKDLEAALGSRARVSEILNRRRPLTMKMVWRLHETFGIPAEALIRPYDLAR